MTAARPEKTDAEKAILSDMESGAPYTIEQIKQLLIYPLDEFLAEALMELVLQNLVSFQEDCYRLTKEGIRHRQRLKQERNAIRKRQHEQY